MLHRTDNAWNNYLYWQTQDRRALKRINTLIRGTLRSPFEGIDKPELLKWGGAAGRMEPTNRFREQTHLYDRWR